MENVPTHIYGKLLCVWKVVAFFRKVSELGFVHHVLDLILEQGLLTLDCRLVLQYLECKISVHRQRTIYKTPIAMMLNLFEVKGWRN